MNSIPDRIVDNAIGLLNSPAPPAGVPQATRCYGLAFDPAALPTLAGYLEEIEVPDPRQAERPVTQDDVHFKFEARVMGTSLVPSDQAADPLIKHAVNRLSGKTSGVTEGSLYYRLLFNGVKYEYAQADRLYCLATIRFIARSQHKTGDLETWA